MIIDVKVDAGAYVPTKAHEHDAGYDLYAIWPEVVPAHYSRTFDTGVHFAIPEGVCGLLVSKSGLNVNCGVTSTGLIDSGYTGSIKVKLYNHSDSDYHVQAGEKISQIVFVPCLDFETNLVMALANTDRGDAGFGSSGKIHPVAAGKLVGDKTEVYKYDYTKYHSPTGVVEFSEKDYLAKILTQLEMINRNLHAIHYNMVFPERWGERKDKEETK